MSNESPIETIVMKRIRRARLIRACMSGPVIAVGVLGLALFGIGREVWVARVFENSPEGFVRMFSYLGYAFLNTRVVVQALSVTVAGAIIYLSNRTAHLIALQLKRAEYA